MYVCACVCVYMSAGWSVGVYLCMYGMSMSLGMYGMNDGMSRGRGVFFRTHDRISDHFGAIGLGPVAVFSSW